MTDTKKLAKLEQEWREANQAMWAEQSKKTKYREEARSTRVEPYYVAARAIEDVINEESKQFDKAIAEGNEKVKSIYRQIEAERNRLSNEKSPWHPEGTKVRRFKYLRSNSPPVQTHDVGVVEVFGPTSAWPANVRSTPPYGQIGVRLLLASGKPSKTFVRVHESNRVDWRIEESK